MDDLALKTTPVYIPDLPQIVTLVITRNRRMVESRISKKISVNPSLLGFFGTCFGKFDYILELHPESPETGFEFLNGLREELFRTSRSFSGSFLPLLCFPLKETKAEQYINPSLPLRTYSVFRIVNGEISSIQDELTKLTKRFSNTQFDMLFNPSSFSYIIKICSNSLSEVYKSLISVRFKAHSIRDFCTFLAISTNHCEDINDSDEVQGTINIKLCDIKLLAEIIKYPATKVRFGYFDLTRDIKRTSLQGLKKEIMKIRRRFKISDPPNWTATVLTIGKSTVLGEIVE